MTKTMVKVIPYNRMIKYMIILLYIIALQLMFTIWPLSSKYTYSSSLVPSFV